MNIHHVPSKSSVFRTVLILCAWVILFDPSSGVMAPLQAQCVQCTSDVAIMPGHGPASALPGHASSDNRRIINVVVNSLGIPDDATGWYESSTGNVNQSVLTAVQNAASDWNNATDQYGNHTGYFPNVSVSATSSDLANADIIVEKQDVAGGCASIHRYTGQVSPLRMSLPQNAPSAPADRLEATVDHEMAHPQGLHNAASSCSNQTIMRASTGCTTALAQNEAGSPQPADVAMSNQFLNQGPTSCAAESDDAPSCSNPCSSPTCPGYSAQGCSNYSETYLESTPSGDYCVDWWEVTDYYACSGSCELLGRDRTYSYTECTDACGGCTCGGTCQNGHCIYTYECSPIIVAVGSNPNFQLTSPEGGVWFDMNGDGVLERVAWTKAGDQAAFLVLDRNGNGVIENGSELFGNHSVLPSGEPVTNGVEALRYYDQQHVGGNNDGEIDSRDSIWSSLRLWIDMNHDGKSQSAELSSLEQWDLTGISLDYQAIRRRDRYGNEYRFRAPCDLGRRNRFAYDVFFATDPRRRPARH